MESDRLVSGIFCEKSGDERVVLEPQPVEHAGFTAFLSWPIREALEALTMSLQVEGG